MEIIIHYEDSKGQVTERDIEVYSAEKGLLKAHCHMRDRPRTFRFDRIRSVFDCETGEEISLDEIRAAVLAVSKNGMRVYRKLSRVA